MRSGARSASSSRLSLERQTRRGEAPSSASRNALRLPGVAPGGSVAAPDQTSARVRPACADAAHSPAFAVMTASVASTFAGHRDVHGVGRNYVAKVA